MALAHKDLWAHVLGRPTEGVAPLTVLDDLGQTKVRDLNVSVDIYQDILRLDVSVDNILIMQVLKTEQQLRKIKSSLLFCELLDFAQMEEHLTASAHVHHEEELLLRLEAPVQFRCERVVDFLHDQLLVDHWFYFLLPG